MLTKANVRAFLGRDWSGYRASKDRAIARYVQVEGVSAAFRMAQTLLDQVWPQIRDEKSRGVEGLREMRKKLDRAETQRRSVDHRHRKGDEAAEGAVVRVRRSGGHRRRRNSVNR